MDKNLINSLQYEVMPQLRITILGTVTEPITLQEAKTWMHIDYSDFDSLIADFLIPSAREASESASGQCYTVRTIQIQNNSKDERIFPWGPYIEDVTWANESLDTTTNYQYSAGFNVANPLPIRLKNAMLKRIATGFAYKQNSIEEAVNATMNMSIVDETNFREDYFV
jgi:hypothetical protein